MHPRRDHIRQLSAAALVAAFVFSSGCSPRAGDVAVRIALERHAIPPELPVMALPYDPQQILDSLALASDLSRPEFPGLDTVLAEYQRRVPEGVAQLYQDWTTARSTVHAISDTLRNLDREAPGYDAVYDRFRGRYEALARQEAELERAMRDESAEDRDLALAAAAAADTLREWESAVYADYDVIAAGRLALSGRNEVALLTEGVGNVAVRLEPGEWWLVARLPHPENPFREYFWNVPLRVDGLTPLQIPLSDRNVTLRWRH